MQILIVIAVVLVIFAVFFWYFRLPRCFRCGSKMRWIMDGLWGCPRCSWKKLDLEKIDDPRQLVRIYREIMKSERLAK